MGGSTVWNFTKTFIKCTNSIKWTMRSHWLNRFWHFAARPLQQSLHTSCRSKRTCIPLIVKYDQLRDCVCFTIPCFPVAAPSLLVEVPTTQPAAGTLPVLAGTINLCTMLLSRTQIHGLCQGSRSPVARPQQAQPAAARRQAVLARDSNKTNWLKELFDFESWAPKSTKIWRLQQYQPPPAAAEQDAGSGDASTSAAAVQHICAPPAGFAAMW